MIPLNMANGNGSEINTQNCKINIHHHNIIYKNVKTEIKGNIIII